MNKYYVHMSHNFDGEVYLWEFDTEEKAKAFLQWVWEDYYNTEIAEGGLYEVNCFYEDVYAKVEWVDGCYTEFNLIYGLDTVSEEFEKKWREKHHDK